MKLCGSDCTMSTFSHCLSSALLLLLQLCPPCHCSTATPLEHEPLFSFNNTWQVLGPFQIGTRGTQKSTSSDSFMINCRQRLPGAQTLLNMKVALEASNITQKHLFEVHCLPMALHIGTSPKRRPQVVCHQPMHP